MKTKLNIDNYISELQNIIKDINYKNLICDREIKLQFLVGNLSKVTLRNIIQLFNILNLDKSKKINSSFIVNKEENLNENEFYFIIGNSKNTEDIIKNLKEISLNEVLK